MGIVFSQEFIPICQLSSEEYSSPIFKRFFNDCIRGGLPIPWKLKLDHCNNHYITANSVFNVNLLYEEYWIICFKSLLITDGKCLVPRCIINTHIRLLILQLMEKKCLQNIRLENVKYFYIYCIILLSFQTKLQNFEEILE